MTRVVADTTPLRYLVVLGHVDLLPALLLVDEREVRREAERRAVTTMGTLRVLELAAERALVDFPTVLSQLQAARFYVTQEMLQELLARDARRKQQNEAPGV